MKLYLKREKSCALLAFIASVREASVSMVVLNNGYILLNSVGLENRGEKKCKVKTSLYFLLCIVGMVNTVLKSNQSIMTCQLS